MSSQLVPEKKDSSEKRARIEQAALHIFAEKGFAAATIAEISSSAGVAEGTIYNYYKNKQDLLLSVIENFIINEPLLSFAQASPADISLSLGNLIKERLDLGRRNPEIIKLMLTEVQRDPKLGKRYYEQVIAKISRLFEGVVARGIAEGEFRDINPHITVRTFLATLIGNLLICNFERDLQGETIRTEDLANGIAEIFLTGILNK